MAEASIDRKIIDDTPKSATNNENAPTEEAQQQQRTSRSPSPSRPLKRKASPSATPAQSKNKTLEKEKEYSSIPAISNEPPLPNEPLPPLPNEPLPEQEDDGWQPVWDDNAQTYYFYNRFSQLTQWENPRIPEAVQAAPGTLPTNHDRIPGDSTDLNLTTVRPVAEGGYNPAIHGDYDPNADYAQIGNGDNDTSNEAKDGTDGAGEAGEYGATARFNRFTGRFQNEGVDPENFNDENKSRRQMNAFFDVDSAANRHNGRSLKAERQGRKLTKNEVKAFKNKRREKKEEKRRAWLRD